MQDNLEGIKNAALSLRSSTASTRNTCLRKLATELENNIEAIVEANRIDLENLPADTSQAFRDRLVLTAERIQSMGEALHEVIKQPDPLNKLIETQILSNGLSLEKRTIPLGVILFIFESRPNVLIESFSIAVKSGNALIAKPGKESKESVKILSTLIRRALKDSELDEHCLNLIPADDRQAIAPLLRRRSEIDLVIPRGGQGLIDYVCENSSIPVLKNDKGQCHIYVHSDALIQPSVQIIENAKVQRPSVCNALETLLIHENIAKPLFADLVEVLKKNKVKVRGCASAQPYFNDYTIDDESGFTLATEQDWTTEHLDLVLNIRIVPSLEDAVAHIQRYGSNHSESIMTESEESFQQFFSALDSAVIYKNASTRFTDGFVFGFGGEMGISTQKLHARGPIGLQELTSYRWIARGTGQKR